MCGAKSCSDTDLLGIVSMSIPSRGWKSKAMLAAEKDKKGAGAGSGDAGAVEVAAPAGRATRGGGAGAAAGGGARDSRHIQYSVLGAYLLALPVVACAACSSLRLFPLLRSLPTTNA